MPCHVFDEDALRCLEDRRREFGKWRCNDNLWILSFVISLEFGANLLETITRKRGDDHRVFGMMRVVRAVFDGVLVLHFPKLTGKGDSLSVHGIHIRIDRFQQRDGVPGHDAGIDQLAANEAGRDVFGFFREPVILIFPVLQSQFRDKKFLPRFGTGLRVVLGK